MKRLIIGLFSAILMSTGLVAFAGSSATAAPYPGTVFTACDAGGGHRVHSGDSPHSWLRVKTAGNGTPRGSFTATYQLVHGDSAKSVTGKYKGGKKSFSGPKLGAEGRYQVRVNFHPRSGSVYKPCHDSYTLRVR